MTQGVVVLPLEGERYAIPTERVRQIVASPVVTSIPTAPPTVRGVFNLRGQIVPLLDTALLLGIATAVASASRSTPYAAVVETPHGDVGLTVSQMPWVAQLGPEVGTTDRPGTAGLHSVGSELVVLIDPDVLLSPSRIGEG